MTLDDYPIDDDYIGVEEAQATVEQSDEYRYDASHTYDRSDDGLAGTERDVEIDRRSVSDRDGRGSTRTGFDANEVDDGPLARTVFREGKKRKYAQWLRTLQNGYRSPRRRQENRLADTNAHLQTFTSVLEMTQFQRERARAIVNSVNMAHMAHYPRELIILATISIVANEDDRWIRDEMAFKDLVRDLDGSMTDVKNARRLVKRKSDIT